MQRQGDELHIDTDEARAAAPKIQIAEPTVSATVAEQGEATGTDTDTIVDDRADELGEPVTERDTQGPGRVEN